MSDFDLARLDALLAERNRLNAEIERVRTRIKQGRAFPKKRAKAIEHEPALVTAPSLNRPRRSKKDYSNGKPVAEPKPLYRSNPSTRFYAGEQPRAGR